MNRSYRKIFKSGIAATVAGSALLMFALCGDDKKDDEFQGYCDFGEPVSYNGDTFGGCYGIPASENIKTSCTDKEGTVVTTCPSYGAPVPGVLCDFGFGNTTPMTAARCNADEYGVVSGQGGYYCDFGQPSEYGNGGCWFRNGVIPEAGYTASYPWGGAPSTGMCASCDVNASGDGCVDGDAHAKKVTMMECRVSNQDNPCITNPNQPHIGQDPAGCNPLRP
ncbi:MAG: hypothetical protein FWB85_11300 [Chitinispirillia bacterium]|nr:hypothetical protein [Chitinispirillia bacterium]MCL2242712.1 hypothetical protein [Chitinispirillia bacterium]